MTKGKLKRNILTFFIAVFFIAAVTGYMMWNKPHVNVKDANALKITAVELYNGLANDSAKAKLIYVNKVVAVSGEVKEVTKNQQNQQIILLKTNIPGGYINCTMEEKDNANNIKAGDTILVKGICSGYIGGDKDMDLPGDVFLIRCYYSS